MQLGEYMTVRREFLGYSRPQMAKKMGTSGSQLKQWEKNEFRPRGKRIEKIAKGLELPISEILEAMGDIALSRRDKRWDDNVYPLEDDVAIIKPIEFPKISFGEPVVETNYVEQIKLQVQKSYQKLEEFFSGNSPLERKLRKKIDENLSEILDKLKNLEIIDQIMTD